MRFAAGRISAQSYGGFPVSILNDSGLVGVVAPRASSYLPEGDPSRRWSLKTWFGLVEEAARR